MGDPKAGGKVWVALEKTAGGVLTYKDCSEAICSKGTTMSGPGENQGETSASVLGSPWSLRGCDFFSWSTSLLSLLPL